MTNSLLTGFAGWLLWAMFLPFAIAAGGSAYALPDSPAAFVAADMAFYAIDYPAATAGYEELLRNHPGDAQVLWRLARVYVCSGEEFEDARRTELCRTAESFARRCIQADSMIAEGHTWLAAALGYIALDEGARRQADISKEILMETGRALKLNPRDDAALSIRGSVFRALGNVTWVKKELASLLFGGVPAGGFAEAEAALRQAIALAPDVMRHYYELGVLYLDWGREEDARQAFEQAVQKPVRVAIDRPRLEKSRLFLSRLKGQ